MFGRTRFGAGRFGAVSASALSAPEVDRSVSCFARWTVDGITYAVGSDTLLWAGAWHLGALTEWPTVEDVARDAWGFRGASDCSLVLSDADGSFAAIGDSMRGVSVVLDLVLTLIRSDGSERTEAFSRTFTCQSWRRKAGAVLELSLSDAEQAALETLYPPYVYATTEWTELFAEDSGHPVPVVVGTCAKVPCALLKTNSGAGPWVFGCAQVTSEGAPSVLAVYRDGVLVASTEYTVGTAAAAGSLYQVRTLTFAFEQADTQGRRYQITADLQGPASRNVASELQRLLGAVGLSTDPSTWASAVSYSDAASLLIDVGYGLSERTRVRALLEQLLPIARAQLYRTATGAYALWQDAPAPVSASYDESAGDLVQLTEWGCEATPSAVTLDFRPASDSSQMQFAIRRQVAGGTAAEAGEQLVAIYYQATADRHLCYRAMRAQYSHSGKAQILGRYHAPGDRIQISGSTVYSGTVDATVISVRRQGQGCELDLIEYSAAVYGYTPGTVPNDASTSYAPDLSKTRPAAPANLGYQTGAAVDADGKVSAWLKAWATPPASNWSSIWFVAENSSTHELYRGQGTDNGDGTWGVVLPGLRPATAHTVLAYCVSPTAVDGFATGSTTFSSGTSSALPSAPTSVTAVQGSGKSIAVSWASSVAANWVAQHVVQRAVGAGSWVEVYRGPSLKFSDTAAGYGSVHSYRVETIDRAGNVSAWSTTAAITPSASIGGGDIDPGSKIPSSKLTIVADDITVGGTLTGNTIQTAASGQRFVVSQVSNDGRWWDSSGALRGVLAYGAIDTYSYSAFFYGGTGGGAYGTAGTGAGFHGYCSASYSYPGLLGESLSSTGAAITGAGRGGGAALQALVGDLVWGGSINATAGVYPRDSAGSGIRRIWISSTSYFEFSSAGLKWVNGGVTKTATFV